MELKQVDVPKGKIMYALSKLRKKHETAPILTIGQLKEATQSIEAPNHIPDDMEDECFAFAADFLDVPGQSTFRILFASKRLLSLAVKNSNIHIDATYKLNWFGFPLLIVGGSDKNRVFPAFM